MKILLLVKQNNFFFNKRNFKFKFYKKYFLKNFKNYFFLGLKKILFLNTMFINVLTLFKKKNYKKVNINQKFPIIFNRKKNYLKFQKKNWLLKPFYFYVKKTDLNFLLKKKIKQNIKKKKQKKLLLKKKLNKKKIKKRIKRSLKKFIKKFRRLKKKKLLNYIFSKYSKKSKKLYFKLLCSSFSIKRKIFYAYSRSRKSLSQTVFLKFYYSKIVTRLSKKYKNYNKKKKQDKKKVRLFRIRWKKKTKLLKVLKKKINIVFLKKKNLKINNKRNLFFLKDNNIFSTFFLSFLRSGFSFFSKIILTKSLFFPIYNKNFFIIKKLKPLIKKIKYFKKEIRLKKLIYKKKKINQINRLIPSKKKVNFYKKRKLNQRFFIIRRRRWIRKKKKHYRRKMRKCFFVFRKRFKRQYFIKHKKLKKFIKFKIKKKNKFCLISLLKLQSFKILFKNKKTCFFKFYKVKNFNLFDKRSDTVFLKNYFNFFLDKNSLSNISKTRNFQPLINLFISNLLHLNFLYKILFKVNVCFKFNFFFKKVFKPILVNKKKISLIDTLRNVFNKSKSTTRLKSFSKKLFRKKLYRYKLFLKRKLKNIKYRRYRYKKIFKRKYKRYLLRLKLKFIDLKRGTHNYKKLSKFLLRLKKKNKFKNKIFMAIFKIILTNYKKKILKKTLNLKTIFNLKNKLYPKIQKKNSIKVIFKNKNQKKFRPVDFIKFKRNKFSFKFFDYFSKLVNLFIKKLFLSTIKHGKKEKALFFLTFCAKRFKKKNKNKKKKLTFFDFMRVVFEKLDSAGAAKNIPFLKKGISRREDFYDSFKLDNRRLKYPVMWIISSAKSRTTEKSFSLKLFNELYDIYKSRNCETLKKLKDFNKNVIYTRHTQGRFRRKFVSRSWRFRRRFRRI